LARAAELARETGAAARARQLVTPREGATVFAFAGKFVARKRPSDFLDALRHAHDNGAPVAGLMIGSGPEESSLRALARDLPVRFAGFQNQTDIATWYAAADCLVLPSDGRETWGLVVNEAMATGLPAIVSDEVGCGPDLITTGETGWLFPVGNVRALANCMSNTAARPPAEVARMRAAVAARIAKYSCDAATAGTLAALDQLTKRKRHTAGHRTAVEHHAESA
jgi:glycosyltransferase involved in cell wall biosynthesis